MKLSSPVLLDKLHDFASFDCGVAPLNDYLKKYALVNQQNRSARTYVALRGLIVVGYFTIANGSVGRAETPPRVSQGLANHPVPITLLARLAVDNSEKSKGLGQALLKDAILRAIQASEIVASRAILTHAKDEIAKAFYERFDLVPSPINPLHLYLLMKDARAILAP